MKKRNLPSDAFPSASGTKRKMSVLFIFCSFQKVCSVTRVNVTHFLCYFQYFTNNGTTSTNKNRALGVKSKKRLTKVCSKSKKILFFFVLLVPGGPSEAADVLTQLCRDASPVTQLCPRRNTSSFQLLLVHLRFLPPLLFPSAASADLTATSQNSTPSLFCSQKMKHALFFSFPDIWNLKAHAVICMWKTD